MNWLNIYIGKIMFFIMKKKNYFLQVYLQYFFSRNIRKVGKCVKFNGISNISGLHAIEIGNNVHIGNNAHIKGHGGLYIGDNTHISRNLVLYTVNHDYHGTLLPYDKNEVARKVIIEKNVWIGMNVVILPGSHIEEGCIIGAGSVVSGRIKRLSIVGASKGNVIKMRDEIHYNDLDQKKLYGAIDGKPLSKKCF